MEEFQEADILWSNHYYDRCDDTDDDEQRDRPLEDRRKSSEPVEVPSKLRSYDVNRSGDDGNEDDTGFDKDDHDDNNGDRVEIIPPHVVVARRISDEMPFSVRVGNGRTLKGRDLKRVRNSVLRMTGFLEA